MFDQPLEFVSWLTTADITFGDMGTISNRVRQHREASGLSQSELARRIKVRPSAINHIESGRTKTLKAETILALAHALGVSAYWLETGTGTPTPDARLIPEESEIITLFRLLRPAKQEALLSIARTLYGEQAGDKASVNNPFPKVRRKV